MTVTIAGPQMKRLWASARELEMDSDAVHALVKAVTGADHISTLTHAQAVQVIDALSTRKGKPPGGVSKKQMWLIRDLARQLGWSDNPKRLRGFTKRQAGVERLEWLTASGARRVVEGLKALLKREKKDDASESH